MDDGLDLGELDITTKDVDFDEMEQDIQRFASEPSVRKVLEVGVDLQNYSAQIKKELDDIESASIEDYLRQIPRVDSLHEEIMACDKTLEAMEDLLVTFKGSLGQLSTEICSLQTRSQEISMKLENRKSLDNFLGEFAREVAITKDFTDAVTNTEAGPNYVKIIVELGNKLKFVQRPDIKTTPAAHETHAKFEQLKGRASEKIRKWMNQEITKIRDNFPDDQMAIQNSLLRCQPLIKFIKEFDPSTADSVESYYADVLSKLYLEVYKYTCKNSLRKMAQISMSPETIVPTMQRAFFKKKLAPGESTLFFSLGEREKLLDDILAPPQVFEEGSFPIESLLRSVYQKLIDTVTAEHAFASYFFDDDNITTTIFTATTKYLESFFDELLPRITDPICTILLLRIIQAEKNEMSRRRCFKINTHLQTVAKKLADRFHAICNNNIQSLEQCDPVVFMENEQTAHHANAMTKRFSEFARSLSLLLDDEVAEIAVPDMHGISASVIDLLERTSKEFKTVELNVIFLINNYCAILATMKTIEGCPLLELFEQKYVDCVEHFVDLQLSLNFKDLFDIVRKAFHKLDSQEPVKIDVIEKELKEIALDFKDNHVDKVKKIAELQFHKFGDFNSAREILMQLAKRLVLYWAKFDQLCKSTIKGPIPPWLQNIVSPQQVVLNIRPITESFC